jgi:hypothetical protein
MTRTLAQKGSTSIRSFGGENTMVARYKQGFALLSLTCVVVGSCPHRTSAMTAELARKCSALTTKQFPPRVPGNPAAGSAKGSGRDQNAYYAKCVANDGKMDDQAK